VARLVLAPVPARPTVIRPPVAAGSPILAALGAAAFPAVVLGAPLSTGAAVAA